MDVRPLQPALVAALVAVASACAAPVVIVPPAPVADSMPAPAAGTLFTYHRVSHGSLGEFDGNVAWTFGRYPMGDSEAVSFVSPVVGGSLHDPASLAIVAMVDATARPTLSFDPPLGPRWPMKVGDAWTTTYQVKTLPSGPKVPMSIRWKVEAWEPVTVPAGRFDAYRVVSTSSLGEVETRWVSPGAQIPTIKRHVERAASHPQGKGVLDAELVSRTPPPVWP